MAEFTIKGSGSSFFVFKDGVQVLGPFYSRDRALGVCDELIRKGRERVRPCMTCQGDFVSEGPHNRMCDPCRIKANDMGMVA